MRTHVRFGIWGAVVVMFGFLFFACGSPEGSDDSRHEGLRVVTTISPLAMILEPVVSGRSMVEALLEPGDSPHTYEPSPSDLNAVSEGAVVVYGAEHLDGWAVEFPDVRSLALVDLLPEEARQSFAEGSHAHADTTVDPHFWTDPRTVVSLLPVLADTLCALDSGGCSTYRANADSFTTTLTALDARLDMMMEPIREVPVLLAQPFFRYFLARYGPRAVGIVEPQPAKEPSPRQIQNLVAQAKTSGAQAILTQRQLSPRAAEAVAEAAEIPLVEIDPLGGAEGRTTYEVLLMDNAQILLDALQEEDQQGRVSLDQPMGDGR